MDPKARRTVARRAALQRWVQARFGASSFDVLGLPGGEMIDVGLVDLAGGVESIESLVVSLAAPRLRREGIPLPSDLIADPELRLYRLLEEGGVELAHARYLAYLQQAASFADACFSARAD